MATPFSEIYDVFLSNVHSYKLAELEEIHLEEELSQWLLGGMAHFTTANNNIHNYNKSMAEFNCDLDFSEKQILGKCMTLEYMNTHLMDEKNLSSALNSKDYRTYNPAKQLEALIKTKDSLSKEIDILMSRWSYKICNIEKLFGVKL